MKKLLSVMLAVMMSVSVLAISAIPAFAVVSPTATTAANKGPTTQVNGVENDTDVTYTPDSDDSYTITFEYTGEGTLIGWEENLNDLGFVEGTDYTKTENSDGTLTICFLTDEAYEAYENGDVIVNALVEFDTTTTTSAAATNDSSTSPDTGIATSVIAGSVAVVGAGVAVLSAAKKKDAE